MAGWRIDWDLLPVVRSHVYHPAFAGSYSLKAVLPALVPEMTYDGMAVANGQDAGLAWESLTKGGLDRVGRDKIRKSLLEYCGKDTLALVKVPATGSHQGFHPPSTRWNRSRGRCESC